jgi:hypothetical protein
MMTDDYVGEQQTHTEHQTPTYSILCVQLVFFSSVTLCVHINTKESCSCAKHHALNTLGIVVVKLHTFLTSV